MASSPGMGAQAQERPSERVFQAATGYMISAALYTAAKLNIADLLADGPRAISELAAETQSDENALYRVLRSLDSLQLFQEIAPRQFALLPAGELLRSGTQGSLRDLAIWITNPFHFRVWAEMPYSVQTGKPAVDYLYGKPCFDAFAAMPDVAREFNDGMTCLSSMIAPALLEAYDFSDTRVLMDVAGGHGYILSEVLQRYPRMRGILFDIPDVIEGAKPRLASLGLASRCQTVAGDFFKHIPDSADTYYMQHIIHDWDDERALHILSNCRDALLKGENRKLLVMDSVIPQTSVPHFGKLLDLEMLLLPGGKERTEPEFRDLFARAGLRITRIIPTNAPQSVIEARVA